MAILYNDYCYFSDDQACQDSNYFWYIHKYNLQTKEDTPVVTFGFLINRDPAFVLNNNRYFYYYMNSYMYIFDVTTDTETSASYDYYPSNAFIANDLLYIYDSDESRLDRFVDLTYESIYLPYAGYDYDILIYYHYLLYDDYNIHIIDFNLNEVKNFDFSDNDFSFKAKALIDNLYIFSFTDGDDGDKNKLLIIDKDTFDYKIITLGDSFLGIYPNGILAIQKVNNSIFSVFTNQEIILIDSSTYQIVKRQSLPSYISKISTVNINNVLYGNIS